MILTILGWLLVLTAAGWTAFATAGAIKGFRSQDTFDHEGAWLFLGGAVFGLAILLFILAFVTGELSIGSTLPDGCYRVYSETDTTYIPGANGTTTPLIYNEQHFLPISC